MMIERNDKQVRTSQKEVAASNPFAPGFLESLPSFEAFGYSTVAALGGNSSAGRSVFLVRRVKDEKLFVLKLARFFEGTWESLRKVAEREYQALSDINHAAVPKLIELLTPDAEPWIGLVQEFVAGATLAESDLDEAELIAVARKLLDILCALQARQLCHLDIRPENIVIDEAGLPHLVDFGSSVHFRHAVEQGNKHSTILGYTPGFIDPQVVLTGAAPTPQTDLYGLGCTLLSVMLQLPTEEFARHFGLAFADNLALRQKKPAHISQGLWGWVLSLVRCNSSQPQPSDARAALAALERALAPALPAPKAPLVLDQKSPPAKRRSRKLVWFAFLFPVVFGTFFFMNRAISDLNNSQLEAPAGSIAMNQSIDSLKMLDTDAEYLRSQEHLNVAVIKTADQDGIISYSRYAIVKYYGSEYEVLLKQIDGVERVTFTESGLTVYREENTDQTWEDIAIALDNRLLWLHDKGTIEVPTLATGELVCRSLCDNSISLKTEVAYELVSADDQKPLTWEQVGVDPDELDLTAYPFAKVKLDTNAEGIARFSVTQRGNLYYSWPKLNDSLTIVLEDLQSRSAEKSE